MDKVFLTIRKITIAPVMAALLLFVVNFFWAGIISFRPAFWTFFLLRGLLRFLILHLLTIAVIVKRYGLSG